MLMPMLAFRPSDETEEIDPPTKAGVMARFYSLIEGADEPNLAGFYSPEDGNGDTADAACVDLQT